MGGEGKRLGLRKSQRSLLPTQAGLNNVAACLVNDANDFYNCEAHSSTCYVFQCILQFSDLFLEDSFRSASIEAIGERIRDGKCRQLATEPSPELGMLALRQLPLA